MQIRYEEFVLSIQFDTPTTFHTNPVFLFRSLLGMQLRRMACINASAKNCMDCNFNRACAYSCIFESIIKKDNQTLPGRDKTSHPYVLALGHYVPLKTPVSNLDLQVTLFGRYIDYFPYVYGAFSRAGQLGIGKKRDTFSITDVTINGKSVLNGDSIEMGSEVKYWSYKSDDTLPAYTGDIFVQLKSPLRYKNQGRYVKTPSSEDFFQCLERRARTLCQLYGETDDSEMACNNQSPSTIGITDKVVRWSEYGHYSARQKGSIQLGGMTGHFTLTGSFTKAELALLQAARLFGAGKNTNFGLGQIDLWKQWEM